MLTGVTPLRHTQCAEPAATRCDVFCSSPATWEQNTWSHLSVIAGSVNHSKPVISFYFSLSAVPLTWYHTGHLRAQVWWDRLWTKCSFSQIEKTGSPLINTACVWRPYRKWEPVDCQMKTYWAQLSALTYLWQRVSVEALLLHSPRDASDTKNEQHNVIRFKESHQTHHDDKLVRNRMLVIWQALRYLQSCGFTVLKISKGHLLCTHLNWQ